MTTSDRTLRSSQKRTVGEDDQDEETELPTPNHTKQLAIRLNDSHSEDYQNDEGIVLPQSSTRKRRNKTLVVSSSSESEELFPSSFTTRPLQRKKAVVTDSDEEATPVTSPLKRKEKASPSSRSRLKKNRRSMVISSDEEASEAQDRAPVGTQESGGTRAPKSSKAKSSDDSENDIIEDVNLVEENGMLDYHIMHCSLIYI
jgi:hypothetical protein